MFGDIYQQPSAVIISLRDIEPTMGLRASLPSPLYQTAAACLTPRHRHGCLKLHVRVGGVQPLRLSTATWRQKRARISRGPYHQCAVLILQSATVGSARGLGRALRALAPYVEIGCWLVIDRFVERIAQRR